MTDKFDGFIFMDKDKQTEFNELNPTLKRFVTSNLQDVVAKMNIEMTLDTVCFAITELHKRIEILEKKNNL